MTVALGSITNLRKLALRSVIVKILETARGLYGNRSET